MALRLRGFCRDAASAACFAGALDAGAEALEAWHAFEASEAHTAKTSFSVACSAAASAAAAGGADSLAAWESAVVLCASFDPGSPPPNSPAGFEWVDGVLVEAMVAGNWVLLDNANLCSPTVLDRLNPLLEPNGELLIPEAGLVGGQPRLLKPAPGFRLLLALDPQHGEVSRAMRNRGIEIFMLPSTSAPSIEVRCPGLDGSVAQGFHPGAGDASPFGEVPALGSWPNLANNDDSGGRAGLRASGQFDGWAQAAQRQCCRSPSGCVCHRPPVTASKSFSDSRSHSSRHPSCSPSTCPSPTTPEMRPPCSAPLAWLQLLRCGLWTWLLLRQRVHPTRTHRRCVSLQCLASCCSLCWSVAGLPQRQRSFRGGRPLAQPLVAPLRQHGVYHWTILKSPPGLSSGQLP